MIPKVTSPSLSGSGNICPPDHSRREEEALATWLNPAMSVLSRTSNGGRMRPPPHIKLRRFPQRLCLRLLFEELNDLAIERWEIIGLAAGYKDTVANYFLIDPFGVGIPEVRF